MLKTSPNGRVVVRRNGASAAIDPVDQYLRKLAVAIAAVPRDTIWRIADCLVDAGVAGRRVYLVGNGGSAATAAHMANDLSKPLDRAGRPLLRVFSLTDNVPLLTAWSNDTGYAEGFARQLANHLEPGDVLVAISTSGNSPNVLRAAELARAGGARVVGLTGPDGGMLVALADYCIRVAADDIGQQEDVHLALNHAITHAIRARLAA